MGPLDLHAIVMQQKDKISKLTLQLEASQSRISHLNAQLLTSLDHLDYQQKELDSERERNDKQRTDREAWKEMIGRLKREKDEMKQAVEMLIEQVERSKHGFTDWPRACMYLPNPVEPSTSVRHNLVDHKFPPQTETMAEILVRILASEQKAHYETLQDLAIAEDQISILNAKVARREAELESCNFQIVEFPMSRPIPSQRSRKITISGHTRPPMNSQEEALSVLQITAERNVTLGKEVKILAQRLAQAQNDRQVDQSTPRPSSLDLPPKRTASVAVQTSPVSPSPPTNIITMPSIKSVAHKLDTTDDPPVFPDTPLTPTNIQASSILDLENQINLFVQVLDRFKKECALITVAIASANTGERLKGSGEAESLDTVPFKQVLLVEEECIRLTRLKHSLTSELTQLRAENDRLRTALHTDSRSPSLEPVPLSDNDPNKNPASTFLSPDLSRSWTDSECERDMEISETPLYGPGLLPSTSDHEDETDSLAGFMLMSFGTSPRTRINNSSVNVEASAETSQTLSSFESHLNIPERRIVERLECSDRLDDAEDETAKRYASLSPSQIPLPLSPDDLSFLGMQAKAHIANIERELEVVKRELEIRDAQLKEVKDIVDDLRKGIVP